MNQREFWWLFFVLCLLLFIYFYPVLTMQEYFFHEDILGVNLSLRALAAHNWLQGTIPLWNPFCYCGMPLLAEGQAGVFYPMNCLFLFLSLPVANNLLTFFQFLIGALGIALLFKTLKVGFAGSLLGSITYLFNTYILCKINHINIIIVMTLAPFILAFVFQALQRREQRYFLVSGLFLAFSLLGGIHPSNSHTILAVLSILFFIPAKKNQHGGRLSSAFFSICGFALLILTALALSALQILPSIELTRLSIRAAASGYYQATQYSWEPHFIPTILFPFLWGNPANHTLATNDFYWEFFAYAGIIPLILAFVLFKHRKDRLVILFVSMALLAIFLALGKYSPLFFLYKLPFAGLFRAPARFLFLYVLSLSILAGIGLDDLMQRKKAGKFRTSVSTSLFASILLLIAVIFYFNQNLITNQLIRLMENNSKLVLKCAGEMQQAGNISQFIQVESNNMLSSLIRFFFILGVTVFAFTSLQKKSSSTFSFALILLNCFDLYSAGAKLNPTIQKDFFDQNSWVADQISRLNSIGRIASISAPHIEMSLRGGYPRAVLTDEYNKAMLQDLGRNVPALIQIRALTGDSPLILRNYHRFLYAVLGSEADPLNSYLTWRDINQFYEFRLNQLHLSDLIRRNQDLLDLANVAYILTKKDIYEENWTPVSEDGPNGLRIYQNTLALPRARFVTSAVRVRNPDEALMLYLKGEIDPRSATAISGEISEIVTDPQEAYSSQDSAAIHWDKDDALEIKLRIQTQKRGFLVLADNDYPGWKASLDGVRTKIFNADICFRAVQIPAGSHEIRFFYDPASFRLGAYISVFSLLLIIFSQIIFLITRNRR